jgi:hypothetical protein
MEIRTDKYSVVYDATTITCEGSLLLNGAKEYEPILNILNMAAQQQQSKSEGLTVDLQNLKFLNSSGINMMTKFVINICDIQTIDLKLKVIIDAKVIWQEKLAKNLQRLMPELVVQSGTR